jgi:hypothetical protein
MKREDELKRLAERVEAIALKWSEPTRSGLLDIARRLRAHDSKEA